MVFNLIIIGLAITLEPIPLTAFILVLASKGGVRKGAAFIFGWLVSLAIVITLTFAVTGNNPPRSNTAPSLGILAVKLLGGLVLVLFGVRQWRRKDRPKKPKKPPKWQAGIDNMTPWFAVVLGPLVQPWGLVALGVATITEAKLSSWESYVALFAFCVVATLVYLALEIYAGFWPTQTQVLLGRVRTWIDTHTDQAIIIVSLSLGFWLIGKSIYDLVS
jgi:threonine/homoserine/homoserine lactone efflux protein